MDEKWTKDLEHYRSLGGIERSMASAQDDAMSASTAVHNQDNAAMEAVGLRRAQCDTR